MSTFSALLISFSISAAAGALAALSAGRGVKSLLKKRPAPSFSPSFRVSAVIEVLCYGACFFILFRLFRYDDNFSFRFSALALLVALMFAGALRNYFFYRRENFLYGFVIGVLRALAAAVVLVCLYQFDYVAAFVLIPYLLRLVYTFYWNYRLLKLNSR